MLELSFIRNYPDIVKDNLRKRNDLEKIEWVDEILNADSKWKELRHQVDQLRHSRNFISEEINRLKKEKKDASRVIEEAKNLPQKIADIEKTASELQDNIHYRLLRLPNVLHETVPVGKDDSENKVINTFGKKQKFTVKPLSHIDLLEKWNLADIERAAKISGARWYFLKNELAILEMALSRYALDFMRKRKYTVTIPPFMINRRSCEGNTSLADFEEVLYKIDGEDLYMIPTSEFPLNAQFADEVMDSARLPLKLAGYSTCFRKEAGAHGKDTKGIFRVHQFNKVEQIIICKPEDSWDLHEELLKNVVDFFDSLGLHCRVVNVCTGDIGIVAAKKYDVEAWMPVQGAYREVASCSNCTSYQAVRLNIRYQEAQERKYVHTLNSTCVATTRALVAILENFQKKDGTIVIPKVLQKYCGFKVIGKAAKKK